ncbi:MAG: divergent polysaccharide deacetylase family protein [Candidatus Omnitrophica bacterium]|nr:divergent polysaccharide deacetylase family protein [Candidatus Omnitrophota bacterium]MCM8790391.1 divergent polysaccharide deacetylase family protein [Candidatus Omnitrophota bacterium]
MRARILTAIIAIIVVFAGFMIWRAGTVVYDWSGRFEKCATAVFLKAGLVDDNLAHKSVEEKKAGRRRYLHTYLEYNVPSSFSWEDFEKSLKSTITRAGFRITAFEQIYKKNVTVYGFTVSRGKYDILSVKVNRLKKAAAILRKKEEMPVATRTGEEPKVAIVIDDLGYSKRNLDKIFGIGQPITFSILPAQRYSKEISAEAKARGYEVILHLPLESRKKDAPEETNTIRSAMSEKDIIARLKKDLDTVPEADGVSNHQGSKATEDRALMSLIMGYLKERGLYFFDSLTSENSVCSEVAAKHGIKCARRDIFLDNSSDPAYIEKQLKETKDLAFSQGRAIAICHDRKNTVMVLAKVMPQMAKEGIRFVYLHELVGK